MKKIILGLVALGGCCVIGIAAIVFIAFQATAGVAEAGDDFMNALKDGNYQTAYNMFSDDLKADVGGVENFQTSYLSLSPELRVDPESWSFSSRNIENDQGELSGEVTMKDGTKADVSLIFNKNGDEWELIGYEFSLKE